MGRCRAGGPALSRVALALISLCILYTPSHAQTSLNANQDLSNTITSAGSAAYVSSVAINVGQVAIVQLSSSGGLGAPITSSTKVYVKYGGTATTSSYDKTATGANLQTILLVADGQCTATNAATLSILVDTTATISYVIQYSTVSCQLTSSSITAVFPADGPLAGGRTITLTGVRMATGVGDVELVTIKNVPATAILSANATQVVVRTGDATGTSGPGQGAVLLVSTSYGLVRSANNVFTVNVGPTVTSVVPTRGPLQGNYTVTITGTNLAFDAADLVSVAFGGVPVTAVDAFATTRIVARTGNATASGVSPGAVDVVVTSTRFGAARLAAGFTYLPRVGARCAGTSNVDLVTSRGRNTLNDGASASATVASTSGPYGSYSSCTWVLNPTGALYQSGAVQAKQFYVSFHYFDVRNGSFFLSSGDFLDIYAASLVGGTTARVASLQGTGLAAVAAGLPASPVALNSYETIIAASALTFLFTSDAADEGLGFQLTYSAGFCDRTSPMVFTASQRTYFEDGSGAYDYGMYSQCDFQIVPTDVQSILRVQLVLEKLDLADGTTLSIYDGDTPASKLLVQLPNPQYATLPVRVTSSGPRMYLRMVSAAGTAVSGTDSGFRAYYDRAVSYFIDSVVPSSGPLRGGNVVTLFGNNMTTGGVADIRTVNVGSIPVVDILSADVIAANLTRVVVVLPDLSSLSSGSIFVDVAVDSATTSVSVGYSLYKTLPGEVCPSRWQTEQSAASGGLLLQQAIDDAIVTYGYNPYPYTLALLRCQSYTAGVYSSLWADVSCYFDAARGAFEPCTFNRTRCSLRPPRDPNAYGCEIYTFSNTTHSVREDLGPAFAAVAPAAAWSGALAGLCANATYAGCVPFSDAVKASVGDALYSDPSGSRMEALQFAAQTARQRGVARFHISLNQIAYALASSFTWATNATSCDWACGLTTASTTCGGRSGPNLFSSVFTISYGC